MNRKLLGLSILGIVFAMVFTLGTAIAGGGAGFTTGGVDRDLALYNESEINNTLFGNDRAYNSPLRGDRDADVRIHSFVPDSYGLMGDYDNWTER